MFGRALMAAAAVVAIALSTGTLLGSFDEAEAGKPELSIDGILVTDDPDCVVTVNWSGLKGGRMLEVGTRLQDASGDPIDDATKSTTARYDAGQVVEDFGDVTGVASVLVTITEQKGNFTTMEFNETCS
jgi:hypothetical protein